MSAQNLELMTWGDGTIRLTFWDSLHGDDKSYVLGDGFVYLSNESGTMTPIDLAVELRKLALEFEAQAQSQRPSI